MRLLLVAIGVMALVFGIASMAGAAGPGGAKAVSVLGVAQVDGETVFVHVWVVVPPGANANEVAREALRGYGARPFDSDEFSTNGLVWDQFSDDNAGNDFVTQNYNPGSSRTEPDPTGGGGETALRNTLSTWTDVATSDFAFSYGGTTNRCPSLVRECRGRQSFDGNNDLAWLKLQEGVLGVTWYSTSIDEADVALSTRFSWSTGGVNDFDVETVLLHENGHVAGLGHSDIAAAVMYAYYGGVRQLLHQDDVDGITSLYPAGPPNDAPNVSISTPTDGATFDSGASVTFEGTASDTEDGDLSSSIAWESSIDGALGTGASIIAALSDGNHTITASVTDLGGASGSASVSITVGTVTEPTAVSVASITYATEGGKNQDKHLLVTVALVDDLGDPVAGASVSIDLYRDGSWIASGTGTTGTGGTLTFSLKNARSGVYTTTVISVTAAGLTWDSTTPLNLFAK